MKETVLKNWFCTLWLLVITFATGHSQTLTIDFVEFKDRTIIIHYDLDDGANSNRQFLIQLYSSQDNFTTPLARVSGDFGTEVTSGFDKKIVWDITKELGIFKGELSFEIRGRVYVPFVKVSNMEAGKSFKRGKNYPVNWLSGNLSGQVNIELFNDSGERLWGESNVANVGKYDWYIPGSIKKGKNYKLKFTNTRERNDVVYSTTFSIRPKVPLLAKIAGIALVAGATTFIANNSETTTTTTREVNIVVDPPRIPKN
jgi:hypothetical protein